MQENKPPDPLTRNIERVQAYVTSTAALRGKEFNALLKHGAGIVWEDTRRTPERMLRELQSYGVVEVISLIASVLLLAIVFLVVTCSPKRGAGIMRVLS